MTVTVLAAEARLLVLLHAATAIVLAGASTHAAVLVAVAARGRPNPRLARRYAAVVAVAYLVTTALGALAYPTYRYHVRGLYLDRYATWASNLFDMKENFAALGLPLVVGAFLLRRAADPDADRRLFPAWAMMVLVSTAIVWFDVIAGLLITMEKGV